MRFDAGDDNLWGGLLLVLCGAVAGYVTHAKVAAFEAGETESIKLWILIADIYESFGSTGLNVTFGVLVLLGLGLMIQGLRAKLG